MGVYVGIIPVLIKGNLHVGQCRVSSNQVYDFRVSVVKAIVRWGLLWGPLFTETTTSCRIIANIPKNWRVKWENDVETRVISGVKRDGSVGV